MMNLFNIDLSKETFDNNDKKAFFSELENYLEKHITEENLHYILDTFINHSSFTINEKIKMIDLIVNSYNQSDYAWRGRKYAIRQKTILDDFDYKSLSVNKRKQYEKIYENLGDFFFSLYNFKTSLDCYQKAEQLHEKPLTDYFIKQVRCHLYLDENYRCPFSKEELKKRYRKYYEALDDLLEYGVPIKNDPVVNSKEFQDCYDDVMEETYKIIKENDMNIHIPQVLWMVMEECFKKRGITWKSPQRMNPRIRFD